MLVCILNMFLQIISCYCQPACQICELLSQSMWSSLRLAPINNADDRDMSHVGNNCMYVCGYAYIIDQWLSPGSQLRSMYMLRVVTYIDMIHLHWLRLRASSVHVLALQSWLLFYWHSRGSCKLWQLTITNKTRWLLPWRFVCASQTSIFIKSFRLENRNEWKGKVSL